MTGSMSSQNWPSETIIHPQDSLLFVVENLPNAVLHENRPHPRLITDLTSFRLLSRHG
jgi:hypothetical protein